MYNIQNKCIFRSALRGKQEKWNLYLKDLIKFIITGWKIFKIGVYLDNYGGDIEYQFITQKLLMKY